MKSQVSLFASKAALMLLGGAALLLATVASPASAQSGAVFQAVRVDLSGLPTGATQTRADIQACLANGLPRVLAGRLNPGARGAPVLIVRPTDIYFTSTSNTSGGQGFGGGTSQIGLDEMSGDAIVGGQRIVIKAANSPISGSNTLPESVARVRTLTLCNNFIFALARKI